ncbi:glycoside hydrolase family 16 protein [Pseudonocardia sp. H11422]|uniref:glycoside hydrolase family 16 protein n=1 Tax=Pseudonocardia sp. H11422 TaxID=2835866 RepID=UPI001BDBC2CA|nr:glycoside hydrolase family 16 protein [Pseudonocardia sp. H11422]
MTIDELEQLIRRYVSTGVAVVVIAIGPGTQAPDLSGLPGEATVVRVEPTPAGGGSAGPGSGSATGGRPRAATTGTGLLGDVTSGSDVADPDVTSDPDSRPGASGVGSDSDFGSGSGSDADERDLTGRSSPGPGAGSDATRVRSPIDSDVGAAGRDLDKVEPQVGTVGSSADGDPGSARDPGEPAPEAGDGDTDVIGDVGSGRDADSGATGGGSETGDSPGGGERPSPGGVDAPVSNRSTDTGGVRADDPGAGTGAGAVDPSTGTAGAATGARAGANGGGPADATAGGSGTTAAERYGWGTPNRADEFDGGTEQWSLYDGPGHAGQGTRSPSALSVENGVLTITGDSSGTTGGMAWNSGQRYGRWEGRVRAPAGDPSYNALLLLWPDAENFPVGGEIDFMEMTDPTRQKTDIVVHHGPDNSQVHGEVEIDATQWHNWAVEWTPESITAYVDGEEWYRTTDTSIFPPGPMHLCIQLDWFPRGGTPAQSRMEVDWVRQYAWDGNSAAGSPETGVGSRPAR